MIKQKILYMALGLAVLLFVIYLFWSKDNAVPNQTAIPVTMAKVKLTEIPHLASATGNLIANQSTYLSPKVSGYVTKILYNEGDFVRAGTPLLQLDNREELDALAAAKSARDVSRAQFLRDRNLLAKGYITQDVFYNAKVTYEQNETAVISCVNKLADKTIRASFDGIVGARTVSLGDYVTAGSKLTSLVDMRHLRVEYFLPSNFQTDVRVGQGVTITSDALPNQQFEGVVTYISASVDPATQTINIHAALDNFDRKLKPGQFVNISQELGEAKMALTVPPQSVFGSVNSYYVYTVKNDKAIKTKVKLGERFSNQVEIIHGLDRSSSVVVEGQNRLSDNTAVKIIK